MYSAEVINLVKCAPAKKKTKAAPKKKATKKKK
jgi:hypothetical protein